MSSINPADASMQVAIRSAVGVRRQKHEGCEYTVIFKDCGSQRNDVFREGDHGLRNITLEPRRPDDAGQPTTSRGKPLALPGVGSCDLVRQSKVHRLKKLRSDSSKTR